MPKIPQLIHNPSFYQMLVKKAQMSGCFQKHVAILFDDRGNIIKIATNTNNYDVLGARHYPDRATIHAEENLLKGFKGSPKMHFEQATVACC